MFTVNSTFLRWYFPYLDQVEDLLDRLGKLSATQLGTAEYLNHPMVLGEARFLRVGALIGWIERQLDRLLVSGVTNHAVGLQHDPGKHRAYVRMPTRFGVGKCLVELPRSVDDYIMCRAAPVVRTNLDVVQSNAVGALAHVQQIEIGELLNRAVLEYLVAHGCDLIYKLYDENGAETELYTELCRLGLHPADFHAAYRSITPYVLAGRPVAVG